MHISDLLFSYKQMVFPAIKAPLFRRILMRIFAVLPVFAVKNYSIFDQIFAYFRSFGFILFQSYFTFSDIWVFRFKDVICIEGLLFFCYKF